jgi:hypothetical protein
MFILHPSLFMIPGVARLSCLPNLGRGLEVLRNTDMYHHRTKDIAVPKV